MIDTYIRAEESEKISAFDDMTLIQLIVDHGPDAVKALPEGIRKRKEAVAETIENNVRKLIIDEQPINPKYYEKMSEHWHLDALIVRNFRHPQSVGIREVFYKKIEELTKKVTNPTKGEAYPRSLNTPAKRALYDNLDKNEALALAVDDAVRKNRQDDSP